MKWVRTMGAMKPLETSSTPNMNAELAEMVPPERTRSALLMSVILHVILLTALGLIWSQTPRGTDASVDRPVGIALVHRLPDRDRYQEIKEVVDPQKELTDDMATSSSASSAAPPADLSPPLDLPGVLESMQSTPQPVSGDGLAGQSDLSGDAFSKGTGVQRSSDSAEATTMVFGVSGSGSRFVYVFDRSDSMNGFGGKPLRAAKSELIRSLRTLTDRQSFQLIFYNDKPKAFQLSGVPDQLFSGEKSYVNLAENYIRSISAFGGTEHESALKMALRMSPDVIFFLTDARIPRLSLSELREIRNLADASGATIHTIEFGADPAAPTDTFLRDLAAQNRGQYQYVDIRRLGTVAPVPQSNDSQTINNLQPAATPDSP